MIFGHLAVAAIAKRIFLRESLIFLMVAAYSPDIIDKTLQALFGLPRRGVGHSLLAWMAVTGVAWFLCRRFDNAMRLLYLGSALWLLHLLSDLPEPVLFWPWVGFVPESPPYSFIEKLYRFYILRAFQFQFYLEVSWLVLATTLWILYVIRK